MEDNIRLKKSEWGTINKLWVDVDIRDKIDIYNDLCISRGNGHSLEQVNNDLNKSYFFGFGESSTGRIFAASWPNGLYRSNNEGNNRTNISSDLFSYNEAYNFQYKNVIILFSNCS